MAATALTQHFPWTTTVAGKRITFRLMTPADREAMREFVNRLTENDLFYLMTDIREQKGVDRWVVRLQEKTTYTVLAELDGKILGYGSLLCGELRWTRHLGEIRIMVDPALRGKGIGALLAKEIFAVAHDLGLRRVIARLASSHRPARKLFEELGFHLEALLADCIIDEENRTQDLVIMSYDVSGFHN